MSQSAYAKISRSGGPRERMFSFSQMAPRRTPMMAFNRFKFSCRTLLFLFVLLGSPMAARSDTLEDSARELARKIAAVVKTPGDMSCQIRNVSSLTPNEVSRIQQAVEVELQSCGVGTPQNVGAAVGVLITFSENLKGFVWAAEIHQLDATQIVLVKVPRSPLSRGTANAMPLLLRSEKIWEGWESVLDVAIQSAPGDAEPSFFLLLPDRLTIRKKSGDSGATISFSATEPILRDPKGWFVQLGNQVIVDLVRRICTIDVKSLAVTGCEKRFPTDPVQTFPICQCRPLREMRWPLFKVVAVTANFWRQAPETIHKRMQCRLSKEVRPRQSATNWNLTDLSSACITLQIETL